MAKSWLDAMAPEVDAKIRAMMAKQRFSPIVAFDFDHVRAAIEIVDAAMVEVESETQKSILERAQHAVKRMGDGLLTGKRPNFIEEGIFSAGAVALLTATHTLPMILHRSLFITICAHTEYVLRSWCRSLHAQWALPTPLGKRNAGESDVQNCMHYLRDVAKLDIAGFETWPEWVQIDIFREIRNALAHDGGLIDQAKVKKVLLFSEAEIDEEGLLLEAGSINLLPDACAKAAETAKSFFERLTAIAERDARVREP